MKVWIEVRILTREFGALKAEIHFLLFVAGRDATTRILAVAFAAAFAVRFAELIQQFFERRIVPEHGQKPGKPLRITIERSQQPFQLGRVLLDFPLGISLALSAVQATRGQDLYDVIVLHDFPPWKCFCRDVIIPLAVLYRSSFFRENTAA
jgi:hypothetical protein